MLAAAAAVFDAICAVSATACLSGSMHREMAFDNLMLMSLLPQELDEQSRTVRFELRFDEPGIRLATDRWERLKLYARPYSELLDQTALGD